MRRRRAAILTSFMCLTPGFASAQTIERLGTRALGMGGAFVGVADDATAVYWNPAGLATGATVSGVFEIGRADILNDKNAPITDTTVASRASSRIVATGATSFAVSNYQLSISETVPAGAVSSLTDKDERRSVPVLARLTTSNYGLTLLQTVSEGVVVGGTLRLVRGTAFSGAIPTSGTVDQALKSTENLPSHKSMAFDLDVGTMLVIGPARVGLLIRNLRQPEFDLPGSSSSLMMRRHARVGLAVTPGRGGYAPGANTNIGLDFDLSQVETPRGRQRDLSAGVEQWFAGHRVGARGGIRVNALDKAQRALSAGASVALRKGSYIDTHMTRGRVDGDRSWTISARVTF